MKPFDVEKEWLEIKKILPKSKDWNQNLMLEIQAKKLYLNKVTSKKFSEDYFKKILDKLIKTEFPFWDIDTSQIPNYKDYRLPENRMDYLKRITLHRLVTGDMDHWHTLAIGGDYFKWDKEQWAFAAMMFGYSYRSQWSIIANQIFPDWKNLSYDDLHKWNSLTDTKTNTFNVHRIPKGRDTRYKPGKLPEAITGVQKFAKECGDGSLFEALRIESTRYEDPNKNFVNITNKVQEISTYGRMAAQLVVDVLDYIFRFPVSGHEMMIGNPNTWSCRIGQNYLLNKIDELQKDLMNKGKYKPNKDELEELITDTEYCCNEIRKDMPMHMGIQVYEGNMCEHLHKEMTEGDFSISNVRGQSEYAGWTTQELNHTVLNNLKIWESYETTNKFPVKPDLTPLVLGQFTKHEHLGGCDNHKYWHKVFSHTGISLNLHYTFKDVPDAYKLFDNLPKPKDLPLDELIEYWNLIKNREKLVEKYEPMKYLEWKPIDYVNKNYLDSVHDQIKDKILLYCDKSKKLGKSWNQIVK